MSYTLTMNCQFCGNVEIEQDKDLHKDLTLDVGACTACASPLKMGAIVKYGAAERSPGDAVHADQYLERGGLYTVSRVHRYQHASYYELKETGRRTFITRLFVPKDFVK